MFSAGSVCAYEYMHVGAYDGKLVEVRGQFAGLISLLLPGSWGANTGYQVWRQALYLLSHVAMPASAVFTSSPHLPILPLQHKVCVSDPGLS